MMNVDINSRYLKKIILLSIIMDIIIETIIEWKLIVILIDLNQKLIKELAVVDLLKELQLILNSNR